MRGRGRVVREAPEGLACARTGVRVLGTSSREQGVKDEEEEKEEKTGKQDVRAAVGNNGRLLSLLVFCRCYCREGLL